MWDSKQDVLGYLPGNMSPLFSLVQFDGQGIVLLYFYLYQLFISGSWGYTNTVVFRFLFFIENAILSRP